MRINMNASSNIIKSKYMDEPILIFSDRGEHIDPKHGISRFGPKSYKSTKRHPQQIRTGFIGTAETIEKSMEWIESNSSGIVGDNIHLEFPGFSENRGFYSKIIFDNDWNAQINNSELKNVLDKKPARKKFEASLDLIDSKINFLANKDLQPEYVVIALPDDLYKECKVINYHDRELGEVHRDFRRAIKALAMKYRLPTQLLRKETVEYTVEDYLEDLEEEQIRKDHPAEIAWDFFTGLYFKAGGLPWGPAGLTPGTCYIGISFFRPLGTKFDTMQTSLIQAFDEHGDGLVLRGHEFVWDSEKEGSKSPHLSDEQASELINMVLNRYFEEMGQTPQRVVVHKTSRFWPAEKYGFTETLQNRIGKYDLLALSPQSMVRLLTTNKYPPLRGTYFSVGNLDFLYTTGYIAELRRFYGRHVPSPIQIADHIGYDTPREVLLKEILILTKMNWNSSRPGGLWPITVRFSRLVGDIMREIPPEREPLTNFKFYM